jgi:protein-S-isoprenylcysteine O-methyltransferase Ste14
LSDNQNQAEEHHDSLFHIILPLAFALVWILDSFIFFFSTVLTYFIPLAVRIALFIGILAIAVVLWAKAHKILFGKLINPEHHKSEKLVSSGIFAYLRHPIYLGNILALLSFVLLTMSLISLLFWILIVIIQDFQAAQEEVHLEELYGDEYRAYKARVRRWGIA